MVLCLLEPLFRKRVVLHQAVPQGAADFFLSGIDQKNRVAVLAKNFMNRSAVADSEQIIAVFYFRMFPPDHNRAFRTPGCTAGTQPGEKRRFFKEIRFSNSRLHLLFKIHQTKCKSTEPAGRRSNSAAVGKTVESPDGEFKIF